MGQHVCTQPTLSSITPGKPSSYVSPYIIASRLLSPQGHAADQPGILESRV